ncbi:MAG TPA: ABC transporter permease [Paracoccaceae bacterium]|nr:ABC transporter permease [Paracoccaceae bacterium]
MRLMNRRPDRVSGLFLMLLPFAALLIAYAIGSAARLAENPADRLLPALSTILETAGSLLTEPDQRSGRILFWQDTLSSLRRLGLGIGIAALMGLVAGIAIGLLPSVRSFLAGFISAFSLVPPLAILPILFIVFGLDELSKVALITLGTAPVLIRDLAQRTLDIPREQLVKAQTLGASTGIIALHVVLPQVLPRLVLAVRLCLGSAWLFLIAAEAIASTDGLGYRIFLVRRYLAMDVILVYVLWITILAFVIDRLLRALSRRMFPWAGRDGL